MNGRLDDILNGREDNYLLPFYWQHGNHRDKIPEQVERIFRSGARAFCVESRPHNDFCGEGWWLDMEVILREASKRGMKVWILDDDHFPTGHAAGQTRNHPELRAWFLTERHVDVLGPVRDSSLILESTNGDNILLGIFAQKRTGEGEKTEGELLDLTSGARGNFVHFDLPEGCWRIFFYYKTRRGSLHPDYIDMIRKESVKLLIDTVYEPHYDHFSNYFGNTIAGFFSDEPSFGNTWAGPHSIDRGMYDDRVGMPGLALPWSDEVLPMMEKTLGIDALPSLSALWFDAGEATGNVRYAYMDAVTKLYRDCFTRQLGDWCEAHGVRYIGHIIEDMNAHARLGASSGHYFRSLDGQHMSGIDIVLHQIIPGMADYVHTGSSFGNNLDPAFFDIVLAKLGSSFAHIGTQTEGRAMCEVFGAYGWAEGTPTMKWLMDYLLVRGVNHFVPHAFSPDFPDPDCPPHFGADDKDPQFEGFSAIMRYTNRAAHILSGMTHKADAAILYHADAEWMNFDGDAMLSQVPAKILYDEHIDFDILSADCFTKSSGSRVFGAEAKDGKLSVGSETYALLIVPAAAKLPRELSESLKKLELEGVKIVYMTKDTKREELIKSVDETTARDVVIGGNFPLLRCIHFFSGTSDVYMFVNESVNSSVSTTATLLSVKDAGKCLMLDLLCGSVRTEKVTDGTVGIELAPYESVIAVFDRDGLPEGIPYREKTVPAVPPELSFDISVAPYTDMENYRPFAKNVRSDRLPNITSASNLPDFSGKIRYDSTFTVKDKKAFSWIDLGEVGVTAHLWMNGKDLGVRVCPPYRYDVSSAIIEGENKLTVVVSNTLGNAIRDWFSSYLTIPASGLIGPLTVLA